VKIYDITCTISEDLPIYPGDPVTRITRVLDAANGDAFTLTSISMSTHLGTHVDAPFHFFPDRATVEDIPLDILIGPASVISIETSSGITARDMERFGVLNSTTRILIKTQGDSKGEHPKAYLTEDAVRWIVERGVKLVGIDTISIDSRDDNELAVHRALLGSGVVILESLDLSEVSPGQYTMICLPLKLKGGDGAPARVVLLEGDAP
jgi:arylformamidase